MKIQHSSLFLLTILLLISCHSNYVHLNNKLHHGACHNADSTQIAFIFSTSAYLPAKGIARFPDGGIPKYLKEDVSLYIFDIEQKKVQKISSFNDLTHLIGSSRTSWQTKIAYCDSLIYCQIHPVMDWQFYLKNVTAQKDTQQIKKLQKKYTQVLVFRDKSKNESQINPAHFTTVYTKKREVDFMNLFNEIKKIPLSSFDLVLQDIYPKSDKEYIRETIYLKNSSPLTRRAVVEQIISKMSKQEIKQLLEKMTEYKNSLEGIEKKKYEMYSEDINKRIRLLLQKK